MVTFTHESPSFGQRSAGYRSDPKLSVYQGMTLQHYGRSFQRIVVIFTKIPFVQIFSLQRLFHTGQCCANFNWMFKKYINYLKITIIVI